MNFLGCKSLILIINGYANLIYIFFCKLFFYPDYSCKTIKKREVFISLRASQGITKTIEEKINVIDSTFHHTHTNHSVIMQKVYQHLAGYHTDDAADDLQVEPTMLRVFSKDRLASQPTIFRVNSKVDEDTVSQFQEVIQSLFDRVQLVKPSDGFIFDLDSANF
ncbi:transposase [Bacillus sp. DJP31]|uniref:transposase n=1 Tax=Bacillus sp. DJP31 TaxID=3409789 RepID=UPI003BB5D134